MPTASGGQGSLIGATLGGYEVQTLIGRGAMGTVYLARDIKLNRQVALKVLLGSLARTPSIVKQFQLEAQAAAPLNHPGIVRVYSAGIERGTPYMAMEFVDGEPLDRFMRRVGRFKWQQAFHIGGQVALALDCAHRHGIVHRDVKPANIMLDRSGGVRLTDFGIASIQSEDSASGGPGPILGTPQYMSPEQVKGEKVGPASDLFSLGVTMFQMISGELPFRGESSMALIKSICTDDPPRLNKIQQGIPDDVARLVAYLMEKRPSARPANARMVQTLVNRIHEHKGGNSAVPAALTQFIKEQAQPRPLSNFGQGTKGNAKRRSTAQRRVKGKIDRRRILKLTGVGALAMAALALSPVMSSMAREGRGNPASTLGLVNFRLLGGGVLQAQLFADGYQFNRVSWVGGHPVALVETRGRPGALTASARGLVAVSPIDQRFTNVRAPVGPALDANYWNGRTAVPGSAYIPSVPEGTPLHDSVPVFVRGANGSQGIILAQRWNEATPRPAVLYAAPPGDASSQTVAMNLNAASGVTWAAVRPDGAGLCLVIAEPGRLNYLAEREVLARPHDLVGRRLTAAGGHILPESVQYSPNGQRLAYLREGGDGGRELWLLDRSRNILDGDRLARNVIGDAFAFSPDSERIAVSVEYAGSGEVVAVVISVADGQVVAELGPGRIAPGAWLPAGQRLLLAAPGSAANGLNREQLWTVETQPPYRRVELTALKEGIEPEYAVSGNGHWAVAVAAHQNYPTLIFVNLLEAAIDGRV